MCFVPWRPKWHPTFAEKRMKTFFWSSYQKKVFMIFVGENLWAKSHKNFLGKFGKILAKILRTPKHFLAPTPMVVTCSYTAAGDP